MKFSGLTTWGKSHLASLATTNSPLRLSKIMVGDGSIQTKEQALALVNLVSYKKTYPIANIESDKNVSVIHAVIDNIGLQSGYTAREIGIYVDLNGEDKLFWYINNDNNVTLVHPISSGIFRVQASYQMIYAENEVEILNTYGVDYFVSKTYLEEYIQARAKVYMGTTPPVETDNIFVDISDPNPNSIPNIDSDLVKIVMKALSEVQSKLAEVDYKLSNKLDAGVRELPTTPTEKFMRIKLSEHFKSRATADVITFMDSRNTEFPPLDSSYPDLEDDYKPDMKAYLEATLKHLCIARGKRDAMGNLLGGELYFDFDEKALYIGDDKGNVYMLCKVGGGGGGGSGNLTGEYLELVSPKGIAFKVRVTDQGSLEVYKSAIDNRPLPDPDDLDKKGWDTYKASDKTGICINQIYSGGKLNSEDTPVSHSFIELYNNSERDISLRGLSIQYAKMGSDWKVCELDGMLPGNTSYLIRCQQNTNPYKLACRLKINNYDMEWDQELSPTGMKVALVVGTKPMTIPDPYKDPPRIEPIHRYIDMMAAGGKRESEKIDYAEGYFTRHCLDKNTALCRGFREGLKDRDSSLLDTMAIDYRYANLEYYAPKCRADGPWDIYRDKLKIADNRPNMIFVTFGKQQSTRIFTWQTKPTNEGFVKIKKIVNTVFENGKYVKKDITGRTKFKTYKAELRNISHHDTSAVTHKVFVRDMTPGIYLYKAGEEGMWSDEYEIEVFHEKYGDFTTQLQVGEKEEDRQIRFLLTSDQQGWDEHEYKAWKHASEYIIENEKIKPEETTGRPNYEWRVNTGDCSQNGNRSYEWRYYYDAAKEDLCTTVEMSVAGNNDLVDKKKSEAYTYYTTYEDSPYPSVYEFFIGDVHFLGFHTWA